MKVYHAEKPDSLDDTVWRRYWRAAGATVDCFGKRLQICERDINTNSWLMSLVEARQKSRDAGQRPVPIFKCRDVIRRFIQQWPPPIAGLMFLLHRERDGPQELVQLAIWMLGRSAGTLGISAVASFVNDSSPAVRREVARALLRMGGWAELRAMAANDVDDRVRRLASPAVPRPFDDRLGRFIDEQMQRRATEQPPRTSRMKFWLNTPLELHPPKPISLIRRLLRHIRRLVHGS